MQFDFATAGRIIFGRGSAKSIPKLASELGTRGLVVTGGRSPLPGISGPRCIVTGEPTVQTARDGVDLFRKERCDLVIGVGGGSVMDAAKAIAALATNSGEPLDYIEVVGRGLAFQNDPAPVIAAPTTAGTGSEVTRNAVVGVPGAGVKASLRSPKMLPRVAVVDPELTFELPPAITASTGLDALTQLIEPFVSSRANALTDLYCREGLRRVARSLRRAYTNGTDVEARTDMAYASLLGGLALANAGLGIVHGFAAPIGGMFPAPHGAVCAALLPHGMKTNVDALWERAPDHPSLERYAEVAAILTGGDRPEDAIAWVSALCQALSIPALRSYGIGETHVEDLAAKAAAASSMKANPIVLTSKELIATLEAAL
jgi:alcohol dehydrogenase class IV